jgi:hypothetical protein
MAETIEATTTESLPRRRPRGRWMAVLTLLVAGAYWWGTDVALNGGGRWHLKWDGLRETNAARTVLIYVFPKPATPGAPRASLGSLVPFLPSPGPPVPSVETTPEQSLLAKQRLREVAAVEGAAHVWERAMWALCGLLAAVALLSWITPRGRGWHLLAATGVFVITCFSLACLRYLEIPDGHGMALWPLKPDTYAALVERWNIPEGGGLPPLLPRTYLALAAILSAYGWLLVAVFIRRKRPPGQKLAEGVATPHPSA